MLGGERNPAGIQQPLLCLKLKLLGGPHLKAQQGPQGTPRPPLHRGVFSFPCILSARPEQPVFPAPPRSLSLLCLCFCCLFALCCAICT